MNDAHARSDDPFASDDPLPPVETSGHSLTLLHGMEPFLRALEDDIERATRRVLVEDYIFADDSFGTWLGGLLERAARRGVEVRSLHDPLGSQKAKRAFFARLREAGVDARSYRPLSTVLREVAVFPRDHSRNVVIDDAAYTGGAAWAKAWFPKKRGGDGWHDVCVRATGPVVEDFARLFDLRWAEADGEPGDPEDFATRDRYPDLELVGDTPGGTRTLVHDRHVAAIDGAKRRVWIENAYFFPGRRFVGALYRAAERGVDVRIITCGPTDLAVVKRAERRDSSSWLAAGMRIFEYDRCTLHAKYAVVDEAWSTVGSFNANPTSLAMANEVNLFVHDREFTSLVARLFERDQGDSVPVDPERLASRSWLEKLGDAASSGLFHALDRITDTGGRRRAG